MLGAEYVQGVQSEGVLATVKHLAGNEAEWQRNSVDSIVDERSLREVYLLPFERCVRAGALAMMTAYNRLNGDHCPNQAWLLRDILRGEWGFDGIVMTDWWGLLDTGRAANAGLDLEMPGPGRSYGAALADAVRFGEVDETVLDEIVTRLLTVLGRLSRTPPGEADDEWPSDGPDQRNLVSAASAASMVLVKNADSLLPIELGPLRRIAIIGPNRPLPTSWGAAARRCDRSGAAPCWTRCADAGTTRWRSSTNPDSPAGRSRRRSNRGI